MMHSRVDISFTGKIVQVAPSSHLIFGIWKSSIKFLVLGITKLPFPFLNLTLTLVYGMAASPTTATAAHHELLYMLYLWGITTTDN